MSRTASRPTWRKEWRWLSLALAAVAGLSSWGHWTWWLDTTIYDAALSSWTRPAPDNIVIVAIDDRSLHALGHWPWQRSIHAQALSLLTDAQPKAVLYNLLLPEPSNDAQQDELLAEQLKRNNHVVLPVGHVVDASGQGRVLAPIPLFSHAARLAHADIALDIDNVLRHTWLAAGSQGQMYPHPALALLDAGDDMGAAASPSAAQSWQRDQRIPIRFDGPAGHIHTISFASLIQGQVPAQALKGKYVLVGVTARGLADTFQTPVSGQDGPMSGVEVTAQVLASIEDRHTFYTAPRAALATLSIIVILGLCWSFRQANPRQALTRAIGTALGTILLAWAAVSLDVWYAPMSTALMAMLTYPIWSWRRLESTSRALDEELRLIASDPSGITPSTTAKVDALDQRTTAIRDAGVQLRAARQLLADTLSSLPVAVYVVDDKQRITHANNRAAQISGMTGPDQLEGADLATALTALNPSDAANWEHLIRRARDNHSEVLTEASQAPNRQFLVRLVPNSIQQGLIVCISDLTQIRQAERHRKELLGFIAHDIRSPQASLIALVELHKMGAAITQEATLEHVETLARNTIDLCDELLQVMRAEDRPITPKTIDVYSLCEQCLDEARPKAALKHMTVQCNWDGESRHLAMVDDYLLHRAVMNLLNNAIKYSPKGTAVTIEVNLRDGGHTIAITDQGPGIPASALCRLFQRYERLDQQPQAKIESGIGLGLVFVDTVARRHGGHVTVHSQEGQGSRFEIWLPEIPPTLQ